jgi:hypothetical protein
MGRLDVAAFLWDLYRLGPTYIDVHSRQFLLSVRICLPGFAYYVMLMLDIDQIHTTLVLFWTVCFPLALMSTQYIDSLQNNDSHIPFGTFTLSDACTVKC